MAMLTTVALVLGTLGPQEPAQPTPTAPAVSSSVDPLRFLWPDTAMALCLRPIGPHSAELDATGLPAILEKQLEGEAVRELFYAASGWLEEELGLGSGELLEEVGHHGMALGWRPQGDSLAWVAVIGLDDSGAVLAQSLDRAADSSTSVSVARAQIPGVQAWTLKVRDLRAQFVCAVVGRALLLAPDVETARDAVERGRTAGAACLATTARFVAFRERARTLDNAEALALGWADLSGLLPRAIAAAPPADRAQVERWLGHLGLDRLGSVGWTVVPQAGRIHERYVVEMPEPRPAWLEALVPTDVNVHANVATLAPRDVVSFGVSHIRIGALHGAIVELLEKAAPEAAEQMTAMTQQVSAMVGVDLLDLVGTLGDRVVTMQWADGDQVVVVDVADPRRLSGEMRRLSMFEATRLGSDELLLPTSGSGAALALSRAQLIVASSERRLRSWLDQQHTAVPHPAVQAHLQSLPTNAISCGWFDLEALSGSMRGSAAMVASAAPQQVARAIGTATEIASTLGQIGWDLSADGDGYVVHVTGPTGGLSGLMAAALGAVMNELSAGADLREAVGRADALRARRVQRLHDLLVAVREAEHRFHAERASYTDLGTLASLGFLDASALERTDEGAWRYGDHLVDVVLDRPLEEGPRSFVVVAWPDEVRRGDVYACTRDGEPMRNELIARNAGLTRVRARDVFTAGAFDGSLAIGWRTLEVEQKATRTGPTRLAAGGASSGERARYAALLALEEKGAAGGDEIVPYLDDESPKIVARAAWALGEITHDRAVPRLVQLVRESSDVEVRRHSMRALWKMRDARTIRASADALADDDAAVRELAAVNLGALKATQATENLIGLAGRTPDEGQAEGSDRSAALVALGEIGDPKVLVPAATAIHQVNKLEEQSLAWMFQTLSPKLPLDDETLALMAVLDHEGMLLRRYAIQRLGELGSPAALKALEGRLASEGPELQKLVEVSLTAIRGTSAEGGEAPPVDLPALWAEAQKRFEDPRVRAMAVAGGAGLFVVLVMFGLLRRRRRRQVEAAQWASFVEPSSDYSGRRPVPRPHAGADRPHAGLRR